MIKEMFDMKLAAFIASSAEALPVAQKLQSLLAVSIETTIWNQNFFRPSDVTLDALLRKAMLYDGGIILYTKDDTSTIRDEDFKVARDNAIFESGLLMGRLGKRRAYIVYEKGVRIPSDLYGVTIIPFTRGVSADAYDSLENVATILGQEIVKENELSNIGMLPSSSLAVGYFCNFLKPIAMQISQGAYVEVGRRRVKDPVSKLIVIIPARIDEDMQNEIRLKFLELGLTKGNFIREGNRDLSVYFAENHGCVTVFDIPSTLSVLKSVAHFVFGKSFVGVDGEESLAISRERINFVRALDWLINNDPCARRFAEIRE